MTNQYKVEIASVPDRCSPVAEIWCGDEQLAELRHDGGEKRLQIFGPRSGAAWDLEVDGFLTALDEARRRL